MANDPMHATFDTPEVAENNQSRIYFIQTLALQKPNWSQVLFSQKLPHMAWLLWPQWYSKAIVRKRDYDFVKYGNLKMTDKEPLLLNIII